MFDDRCMTTMLGRCLLPQYVNTCDQWRIYGVHEPPPPPPKGEEEKEKGKGIRRKGTGNGETWTATRTPPPPCSLVAGIFQRYTTCAPKSF